MKIEYLQQFITLAEIKNYQKAADALFISQSTLTKHVQSLEKDLGCQLVRRKGRNFELTDSGLLVVRYGRGILDANQWLLTALKENQANEKIEINIGSTAVMIEYGLLQLVKKAMAAMPRLRCNVQELTAQEINSRFDQDKIDLVFVRESSPAPTGPASCNILKENLVAMCPASSPFAGQDQLSLADLEDEPILSTVLTSPEYRLLSQWFADYYDSHDQAGLKKYPNVVFTANRIENLVSMVQAGAGTAILPKRQAEYYQTKDTAIIPLKEDLPLYLNLLVNPHLLDDQQRPPKHIRRFIDIVLGN
ncbi:hyalin [Lactobacillus nasalidis]|uniref:Hyalin n=1 Tax=Lactobacillus nasalidis TaxID=2797258 RepID=A0ABQ3W9K6_9LACO|nr:LysR family transcriptional regulator [Lactobacillus nasalidis]GHV98135.1 hyalin [Lactobacillus nasalidis]GHW00201.1 hyalin [Lactobacillus nasalidis]GHW01562.1 hyalin [Lactobacillus nasalidis]